MNVAMLQELGLSKNEGRIYEALITYGGSGVSTISLRSKVHRRNAYDTIHRLIEKGLVYEVFSEGETVYEAVDPAKLLELVKEKERMLEAALPEFLSLYRQHRASERAYIYKGLEGVKNYLREMLKVGEDIYCLAAKGAWFDPRIESFTQWFLTEAKQKGIQYHHIFDHEVEDGLQQIPRAFGKSYKFLPKKYSTISTMHIFGDRVVTFTGLHLGRLEDDVTIFVMVSPQLANDYRTWWQIIWDLLPEPRKTRGKR